MTLLTAFFRCYHCVRSTVSISWKNHLPTGEFTHWMAELLTNTFLD